MSFTTYQGLQFSANTPPELLPLLYHLYAGGQRLKITYTNGTTETGVLTTTGAHFLAIAYRASGDGVLLRTHDIAAIEQQGRLLWHRPEAPL